MIVLLMGMAVEDDTSMMGGTFDGVATPLMVEFNCVQHGVKYLLFFNGHQESILGEAKIAYLELTDQG